MTIAITQTILVIVCILIGFGLAGGGRRDDR